MEKIATEGVVVNAIPFRNYDCILTLFTPQEGLIKLFFRGAYSPKKGNGSGTTTPLSVVEAVYAKGRGDLHSCIEIGVIDHNLSLRNNLSTLQAACEMLRSISTTQQPGKTAPELYKLFRLYLKKLPQATFPQAMVSSFRLKLLRYEGLLSFLSHCSECNRILNEIWIHEGEPFCQSHKPPEACYLTHDERLITECLAFSRDFAVLTGIEVTAGLSKKIGYLFDGLI